MNSFVGQFNAALFDASLSAWLFKALHLSQGRTFEHLNIQTLEHLNSQTLSFLDT